MRYQTQDPGRTLIRVAGADAETFLQGLVTNDVTQASPESAVYAALLTPQGKYLADFLILRPASAMFLLDVDAGLAPALSQRLTMYKLRADVAITPEAGYSATLVWDDPVDDGEAPVEVDARIFRDPRDPALGWRAWRVGEATAPFGEAVEIEAYRRRTVALRVPASGVDLAVNESFPLEYDFVRLNGVDFKKGCYVGQEVTARMRHKAKLKKALFEIGIEGGAPAPGAEVLLGERAAGRMGSVVGDRGLALLRLDRVGEGPLSSAEGGTVRVVAGPTGAKDPS